LGASRTGHFVLDLTVIEIGSPSLFDGFIYRIDSDTTDCTPHVGPPSSKRILWKNSSHAKKKSPFSSKKRKEYWKIHWQRPFFLEWRTKDQSNVKVYDQKKSVDYADYKVGLFNTSPFDLLVEGEPVITKLEKKRSRSV
jgi:hypothetical protein